MPEKGEGIVILIALRHGPVVGSASPPARPTLDGSVPRSFLDCGHAEPEVDARNSGVNLSRSAGRQYLGIVAPATAPDDPERGLGCARRIRRPATRHSISHHTNRHTIPRRSRSCHRDPSGWARTSRPRLCKDTHRRP